MEIEYNPACSRCRQIAGKDPAGVKEDSLCVGHLREEVAALRQRLARLVEAIEEYFNPKERCPDDLIKAYGLLEKSKKRRRF
jgi:hypothetical protein